MCVLTVLLIGGMVWAMKNRPKIDGRAILKKLADERHDRKKTSLYISARLFDEFKTACGEEDSPSTVLEELMRGFVESMRASKPR